MGSVQPEITPPNNFHQFRDTTGGLGCRTSAGQLLFVESVVTAGMARASCVRRSSKIISAKGRFGDLCTGYTMRALEDMLVQYPRGHVC